MLAGPRLICDAADLPDGGPGVRFDLQTAEGSVPAFAVRHRGKAYGYLNRCAHVGVELDWLPGQFFDDSGLYLICATHGATYDPVTGRCVHGPCKGQSLTPLALAERDGKVYLE